MANGIMTLGDFQNATYPNLSNRWVMMGQERQPDMIPSMFSVQGSAQAVEVHTTYNGLETMVPIEEGGTAPPDAMQQQHTKYYTHQEYRKSFNVTRKLLDDGKAFDVMQRGNEELGKAYVETQNITAYSAVNNGFSAEKSADGIAVFSASHLSTAGTVSNIVSTSAALSEASIEQMNIEVRKAKNDRGNRLNLRMVGLKIPVDIEANACRLIDNPDRPSTTDRDINYTNRKGLFSGGYEAIVYLSDTAAWFVTTTENQRDGFQLYNRVGHEIKSTVDDETDNMIVRSYARWAYGCTNHFCCWASTGV